MGGWGRGGLKQVSRGLHGINRALKKKKKKKKKKAFQVKTKAKTIKLNVFHFISLLTSYPNVCFFVLFFSSIFYMEHQVLRNWLHNMSTLVLAVKVLRHVQQL